MNARLRAVPDPPFEPARSSDGPGASTRADDTPLFAARSFYWSVRRELWEHRSISIAPLAAAGVLLLAFWSRAGGLAERTLKAAALEPAKQSAAMSQAYEIVAALIVFTALIVGWFYCLDALHGERRDRSILFWKSLPVSDLTTVLSKAGIALVVLPSIALVVGLAVQLIMLLSSAVILTIEGTGAALLWSRLPLLEMPVLLLYRVAIVSLWYAPIYGWLLLLSAWSRRSALAWAVLPPLGICAVEYLVFESSHVASLLLQRLRFFTQALFDLPPRPVEFLAAGGLWIGLAITVACLAAAVRLRRHHEAI